MTVPAAKVKALCTDAEVALVRASRKGELETLSAAQVKQYAVRARKHVGKWRDLKRDQSRTKGRQSGDSTVDANTKLKKQIFREALASFEAQLAKLEATGTSSKAAAETPKRTTTKHRSAEHRATRAAVRKGMIATQDLVNSEVRPAAKPAAKASAKPAAKAPVVAAESAPKTHAPAKGVKKSRFTAKLALAATTVPTVPKSNVMNRALQQQASLAAKKSRAARSGKTTRLVSHVKSSGKRAQARRDAK